MRRSLRAAGREESRSGQEMRSPLPMLAGVRTSGTLEYAAWTDSCVGGLVWNRQPPLSGGTCHQRGSAIGPPSTAS